jgi:hypothetical protein
MDREYNSGVPREELGLQLEPFNKEEAERNESSLENLEKMGIHPHFVEHEIEAKLSVRQDNATPEQVLRQARNTLEQAGYTFMGNMETHNNYVVYYNLPDQPDHKGKIVIRNRGVSGYQAKRKSPKLLSKIDHILIKKETKSPVFGNLQEAENFLSKQVQIPNPAEHRESVVCRKACKETLVAPGERGVVRYYRLGVDEVEIPGKSVHDERLRQIELEYKGSNSKDEDNLDSIQDQMNLITQVIKSNSVINVKKTKESKREWARAQKKH